MKKLLFSFMVILSAHVANAQLSIGPIAGLSLSNIKNTFDFSVDYKPVLRYFAGAQVQYASSERFSIGLTAQYSAKGFGINLDASPFTEYRLDYFEIVPFAEYKPVKAIGVILGVNLGYLTGTLVKSEDNWINIDYGLVEKWDVGALVGVRYYFKNMYAGLSYNRGILPISDIELTNENGESLGEAKQFNKSLQLGVGYNFHLKKK
jgi:hypothetical protein